MQKEIKIVVDYEDNQPKAISFEYDDDGHVEANFIRLVQVVHVMAYKHFEIEKEQALEIEEEKFGVGWGLNMKSSFNGKEFESTDCEYCGGSNITFEDSGFFNTIGIYACPICHDKEG